jgi:hypothetical protein
MRNNGLIVQPVSRARKRRELASSRVSWPIVRAVRILAPFYARLVLRFSRVEIRHPERLIHAYQDFHAGQNRLIVAFRHPYGDEPQLMFHAIDNVLPRLARQLNMPLARLPHLRQIHDYAVPLWGDAVIRFILPRVGAVPIYHTKVDPESLKRIRSIMANDDCALGLAPEGQVSYHAETLPRIEQGAVRMGFWCARDIEAADRPEKVLILPVSIHYQYDRRDIGRVLKAASELEAICGIPATRTHWGLAGDEALAVLTARLAHIEDRLYEILSEYYAGLEHRTVHDLPPGTDRWGHLIRVAADVAEHLLGLSTRGDLTERLYRIRQEGWDRIYPTALSDKKPPLANALTSRRAAEAWHAMRHMEFIDLMSYHDTTYLQGKSCSAPSYDRIVESLVNFQDLAARIRGGTIANRPTSIRKHAVLIPAPGLDLTAHLPDYRKNAKQTVLEMTDELGRQFIDCIKEYLHENEV